MTDISEKERSASILGVPTIAQLEENKSAKNGNFFDKAIDKTIDFIFSNSSKKWALLIFILGFIIRAAFSLRASFGADEMVYGTLTPGFINAGKLQNIYGAPLWFWLTDFSMKIFGVNVFGLRFLSVFLGSLSIILVYLLGKELFNEKVGLIACFIFALSPLQLFHTVALMDIPAFFFAFFSLYLLILFFKSSKNRFFVLSWISLGIGIMIKQFIVIFAPAFVFFILYYNKKYHDNYKIKQIFYAVLIILLMISPVFVYNYLLYKDKGIVDVQLSRFTGIATEVYAGMASTMQPFSFRTMLISHGNGLPGVLQALQIFYRTESLAVIALTLVGLFFFYKNKGRFKWLFVLAFLFPLLFLAGTSLSSNHFVFGSFYTSLLSSLAIANFSEKFNIKTKQIFVLALLLLILLTSLAMVYQRDGGIFGKHEIAKLIDFKEENIEETSLVVVDSRIYTGRTAFMFWDRFYLQSNHFASAFNNLDSFEGNQANIKTYFVEAVTDDSGWGTVKDQPDFNKSSEQTASFFKASSSLIKTIPSTDGQPHFNVYETTMQLKTSILPYAASTHTWFYYPVGYQPVQKNLDYYEIYNTPDVLFDKFAHLILFLEILAFGLLSIYLFYLFSK